MDVPFVSHHFISYNHPVNFHVSAKPPQRGCSSATIPTKNPTGISIQSSNNAALSACERPVIDGLYLY